MVTQCHQYSLTSSRNEIITDTKTNGTPLCVESERERERGNVCTMRGREMRQKVENEKERGSESKRRRKEEKEETREKYM